MAFRQIKAKTKSKAEFPEALMGSCGDCCFSFHFTILHSTFQLRPLEPQQIIYITCVCELTCLPHNQWLTSDIPHHGLPLKQLKPMDPNYCVDEMGWTSINPSYIPAPGSLPRFWAPHKASAVAGGSVFGRCCRRVPQYAPMGQTYFHGSLVEALLSIFYGHNGHSIY